MSDFRGVRRRAVVPSLNKGVGTNWSWGDTCDAASLAVTTPGDITGCSMRTASAPAGDMLIPPMRPRPMRRVGLRRVSHGETRCSEYLAARQDAYSNSASVTRYQCVA